MTIEYGTVITNYFISKEIFIMNKNFNNNNGFNNNSNNNEFNFGGIVMMSGTITTKEAFVGTVKAAI